MPWEGLCVVGTMPAGVKVTRPSLGLFRQPGTGPSTEGRQQRAVPGACAQWRHFQEEAPGGTSLYGFHHLRDSLTTSASPSPEGHPVCFQAT